MARWQVLKDSIPVAVCDTIQEAEEKYLKYDCDIIKRVEEKEKTDD